MQRSEGGLLRTSRSAVRIVDEAQVRVDCARASGRDEVSLTEDRQPVGQRNLQLCTEHKGVVQFAQIAEHGVHLAVLIGQTAPEGGLYRVVPDVLVVGVGLRNGDQRYRSRTECARIALALIVDQTPSVDRGDSW